MSDGGRIGILRPLRIRDFKLLWIGLSVSLTGDGIYVVAIAWQVLQMSNAPSALAIVLLAWT
ncbi:MAG: MFS transporter, partial [Actinomycetota bacterium]|nr:MFS transporter [Actinomycetota bacterium]